VVSGGPPSYFTSGGDSSSVMGSPGATAASIRLPTVPVPTTSMFSSMPVISQAATQNYLFTSLPQHSSQPTFDVAMLQAKPIGANPGLAGNRIPVSNSNDTFQQFLNLPK